MEAHMKPRLYQSNLMNSLAKELAKYKRVICQLITGGGKTFIFSTVISKHLQKDVFNRVLVLTHRVEIFSQTVSSIAGVGVTVTELKAGQKTKRIHSEARCLVAMVETYKRRKVKDFGKFSMIIVDECHRRDFEPILKKYPDCYVIGVTATPISSSKKHPLKNVYNSIVTGPSFDDLINQGYLAKPRHYKADFDDSDLKIRGGEYTSQSQYETFNNKIHYDNLVDLWESHAGDKKTIVFNINQEHTRHVDEMFKSKNVKSTSILSGDKDRFEKIEQFKKGEIQVLNNCEIFTMGFNVPDVECIVLNRATQSLPLYLQMIGRGARVTQAKDEFTVLDFGGNIDRHGLANIDRDWKQIFWNPGIAGENPAPHRECEECGWLMFASIRICPGCGAVQPTPEQKEAERVRGYLEEVGATHIEGAHIDDLSISELYHLEKTGKYKPSYIARVARTRGEDALAEYAKMKGYSNKWLFYQSKLPKGYNNYRVRL